MTDNGTGRYVSAWCDVFSKMSGSMDTSTIETFRGGGTEEGWESLIAARLTRDSEQNDVLITGFHGTAKITRNFW